MRGGQSPAGGNGKRRGRFAWGVIAWPLVIGLIYFFLLMPLFVVVIGSFNDSLTIALIPSTYSLRWYREFLANSTFTGAFQFSLVLAALTSLLSTAIGFCSAYAIARFRHGLRDVVQSLSLLPVMIPNALIGMALLLILTVVSVPEYVALLAGHVIITLPFAIAAILASFSGLDETLEAAALTLGASRLRVAFEVIVPLVAPGLISGALFAFIVSFGDVYVSLFLASPGRVPLPIEIFMFMQWENTPVIAAITSIQILMIIIIGLIVDRLVGLKSILRIRD